MKKLVSWCIQLIWVFFSFAFPIALASYFFGVFVPSLYMTSDTVLFAYGHFNGFLMTFPTLMLILGFLFGGYPFLDQLDAHLNSKKTSPEKEAVLQKEKYLSLRDATLITLFGLFLWPLQAANFYLINSEGVSFRKFGHLNQEFVPWTQVQSVTIARPNLQAGFYDIKLHSTNQVIDLTTQLRDNHFDNTVLGKEMKKTGISVQIEPGYSHFIQSKGNMHKEQNFINSYLGL